jgi:hypothetical protein
VVAVSKESAGKSSPRTENQQAAARPWKNGSDLRESLERIVLRIAGPGFE